MNSPANSDRREHERRTLRGNATVTLGVKQQFEVRIVDISAGGMAIVANANPRPGTTFAIEFALPKRPQGTVACAARAQVMHSVLASDERGFKIGLKFVELGDEASAAILRYLK